MIAAIVEVEVTTQTQLNSIFEFDEKKQTRPHSIKGRVSMIINNNNRNKKTLIYSQYNHKRRHKRHVSNVILIYRTERRHDIKKKQLYFESNDNASIYA